MNELYRPDKCADCKFCFRALNFGEWHYCTELHRELSLGFAEFTTLDDCPLEKTPPMISTFLGKPIEYWFKLDQWAKEFCYEKLIAENARLTLENEKLKIKIDSIESFFKKAEER